MTRIVFFAYGALCYAVFFLTFLYLVGFLGNLVVPKSIDTGVEGPLWQALAINTLLIALFGVQHSVMARPRFKRWFTRIVPAPIERSTYVLLSSLILILLFWQWRPMTTVVWRVETGGLELALRAIFFGGVALVLYASFLIDHFDLFGLRQVFLHLRRRPYIHPGFAIPALYRLIRHPLYLGWLLTIWFTPEMTTGHLLFAVLAMTYIFVAIPLEERDLAFFLGDDYRRYRERTPMLIPLSKVRRPREGPQKAY